MSNLDCGIYKITHLPSGQIYVGQSICMSKRWDAHQSALRRGSHENGRLQRLWNADGSDAFARATVLVCGVDDLPYYEKALQAALGATLNGKAGHSVKRRLPKGPVVSFSCAVPKSIGDAFRASLPRGQSAGRRLGILLERDLRERARKRRTSQAERSA